MTATSFLRHRRAVAAKYIMASLSGRHKALTVELLEENGLTPNDLATLASNNDVLSIADDLAAKKLEQPELDALEELNTVEVGERSAVHSPDVRGDQWEDFLQHPAQETVGVGNMHDGPTAAEDLANVGARAVQDADGSLAEAARLKAHKDSLASHDLPAGAPTSAPAGENQLTAEDAKTPTDPEGANPGPETVVDLDQAAADLKDQQRDSERVEKLGIAALEAITDKQELLDYAAKVGLVPLEGVTERSTAATIRRAIVNAQGES